MFIYPYPGKRAPLFTAMVSIVDCVVRENRPDRINHDWQAQYHEIRNAWQRTPERIRIAFGELYRTAYERYEALPRSDKTTRVEFQQAAEEVCIVATAIIALREITFEIARDRNEYEAQR